MYHLMGRCLGGLEQSDKRRDEANVLPSHPPTPTTHVSRLGVLTRTSSHWGGEPTRMETLGPMVSMEENIFSKPVGVDVRAPVSVIAIPG